MELTGAFTVERPKDEVWAALNDADTLRGAIPGCQTLIAQGDGYDATVQLKFGPVKARFSGRVTIAEAVCAQKLVLAGEGNGGVAGFAKGGATVLLADKGMGTVVSYTADVAIGGKLAQLGSRLVASTSKKLATQFFDRLNEILMQQEEQAR